ncbi:MAG: hypothetical protein ACLU4J_06145 [Butyricimonas paravirosa]
MKEIKENTQNTRYIDADISMKVEWEIIKGLMFTTHGIYNVNSNHDRTVEGPGTYTNYKNNWYQSMLGWSVKWTRIWRKVLCGKVLPTRTVTR